MKVDAKSALIGRKKSVDGNPDVRPCFISLFDGNNPHKSGEVPKEIIEYDEVHKVIINGLDVNYLLPGNDLVINNLEHLEIEVNGPHITISGKHC
jgi:hypothetical protein